MEMVKKLWYGVISLLVVGLAVFVVMRPCSRKAGFIENEKVFNGFRGKVILEAKLEAMRERHRLTLDSLNRIGEVASGFPVAAETAQLKARFLQEEDVLSTRYTADIWKEINRYTDDFGKQEGYDFIYGATGNGSLMFGNRTFDVSEELIGYMNKRYEAGE